MNVSQNTPSSPSKALRQNPNATYKFSRLEARAELRSTMCEKTTIISLQDMMYHFLPPITKGTKAIPNVFTKVPKFKTEKDMYKYLTERLNGSGQFNSRTFAATGYKPDQTDPSRQTVDCGMYDSKDAPPMEYTAEGDEESRRCLWALVQLLIECKLETVSQDPFDESSDNNEATAAKRREVLGQILSYAELAFKYQQREFVFMVLFLGRYARVVRFDRSGIISSEKIDYTKRGPGAELTEFLVRYARLGPKNRGHDPTAIRILPTDTLGAKLTQHGAAAAERDSEDHVQQLFNKSLDPQWPWWKLCVHDEVSNNKRWFAVGKPHFYAGGVAGRGTRGYVAVPLIEDEDGHSIDPQGKFVYLKDAWRVNHKGMEKEGTILKALNDAQVPYIPTLLYHGDLDKQSTVSYDLWPELNDAETREQCPLKSHQHYRLVVAEVGKPLSEFEHAFQLVWALFCCISAHEKACAAGFIHRDVSAGNILLYKDEKGQWAGLLNDWELAKKFDGGVTTFGGRQLDRTGTWQFMSVKVLLNSTHLMGIPDDLESFFHVLIYFAIRFLPHNLPDDAVGRFLYNYFDDYTDGMAGFTCGPAKYYAIQTGVIDLTLITGGTVCAEGELEKQPLNFFTTTPSSDEVNSGVPESHPINDLIVELLEAFQAHYYPKKPAEENQPRNKNDEASLSLPPDVMALIQQKAKKSKGASTSASQAHPVDNSLLAEKIRKHASMKDVILDHFGKSKWPRFDKGKDKKPLEGYVPAKENNAVASIIKTGSKRGVEDVAGESMSKRVRQSRA